MLACIYILCSGCLFIHRNLLDSTTDPDPTESVGLQFERCFRVAAVKRWKFEESFRDKQRECPTDTDPSDAVRRDVLPRPYILPTHKFRQHEIRGCGRES